MFEDVLVILQNDIWLALLVAFIAYILGDINFSIIVSKATADDDIRDHGSGNAGATNVLRTYGKRAAIFTAIGDVGKAVLAVFLGEYLMASFATSGVSADHLKLFGGYIAGLFCVLGHILPAMFSFRGGKGILAGLGLMLVLDWRAAIIGLVVFGIVVGITRYVSLGSIIAALSIDAALFVFQKFVDKLDLQTVLFCMLVFSIVVITVILKHFSNIQRLVRGEENKVHWNKAKK